LGDGVTGELEAAALGSLSGLVRRGKAHRPEPGEVCANCGTVLEGPYCHVCGQDSDRHKRSILARHVPPFRMFLVALVLFLFAAEHATHQQTLANNAEKQAHKALLATPAGRVSESAKMRKAAADELASDLKEDAQDRDGDLMDKDANRDKIAASYARRVAKAQDRYTGGLARADRVAQGLPEEDPKVSVDLDVGGKKTSGGWWKSGIKKATDNPDYYWSVLFEWGHRAAVLLLPIVGLSLALVYRRRKTVFLYDHLLVAMNILSFSFLVTAVGFLLPFKLMTWWFGLWALWSLVNLFQTLRGAYGSSILGALLKTAIVWWIALMSSFILMVCLLVFAITQL
jgi:hypothetical protein